jgi:hypothetical protein
MVEKVPDKHKRIKETRMIYYLDETWVITGHTVKKVLTQQLKQKSKPKWTVYGKTPTAKANGCCTHR